MGSKGTHQIGLAKRVKLGVIILGNKGAGKTTTILKLMETGSFSFMGDETTHIIKRTPIIHAFPKVINLISQPTDGGERIKNWVRPEKLFNDIFKDFCRASFLFFLGKAKQNSVRIEKLSTNKAIENLLQHHVDVGSSFDEAINTIILMAIKCDSYLIHHNGFSSLDEVALEIQDIVEALQFASVPMAQANLGGSA